MECEWEQNCFDQQRGKWNTPENIDISVLTYIRTYEQILIFKGHIRERITMKRELSYTEQ